MPALAAAAPFVSCPTIEGIKPAAINKAVGSLPALESPDLILEPKPPPLALLSSAALLFRARLPFVLSMVAFF